LVGIHQPHSLIHSHLSPTITVGCQICLVFFPDGVIAGRFTDRSHQLSFRECKWVLQSDIDAETVKEWHFEIPRTLLAKTFGIV
jgi:hypothetical protein